MSTYTPKRKTATGVENISFPIDAINGLQDTLDELNNKTLDMPKIRLGAVGDLDNTMIPSFTNPLKFAVHITNGKLQIGDEVQICTRQLFTYRNENKRKYKLRSVWNTPITEENKNDKVIFVKIFENVDIPSNHLFKSGSISAMGTLSPLYIRIRRPIYKNGFDVDAKFSNIVTVWKKYNLDNGKVFIK